MLVCRILAQQVNFLILDEPTNHLDIKNQFKFFETIKSLNYTVFAVLHDLNMATKFCDYVYVLHEGRIYAQGTPQKVFTQNLLKDIFGMEANIHQINEEKIYIEYLNTIKIK